MKNIKKIILLFSALLISLTLFSCAEGNEPEEGETGIFLVNGTDMQSATISADLSRNYYEDTAKALRDHIASVTGYELLLTDVENAGERAIIIRHSSLEGDESFRVYTEDKRIIIECAYDNMLKDSVMKFAEEKLTLTDGVISLSGKLYSRDISVVYYSDFGAVGDGVAEDFNAIYHAHAFANISGQTVKATPGARYNISDNHKKNEGSIVKEYVSIKVKTNVDWQGAEFILDDREISTKSSVYARRSINIFQIVSDSDLGSHTVYDSEMIDRIALEGLRPGTTKINFKLEGWDGDLLIYPYDTSHLVFRRRGYDQFQGAAQHELIVIDKDGNVDPDTPIMFNYENLSYITARKIDKSRAITIQNGTFITLSSLQESGYIQRNLLVNRSYTTLINVKQYIEDGLPLGTDKGPMYSGFFQVSACTDVTLLECVFSATRYYGGGTYGFSAKNANRVTLKNCYQDNFFVTVDENNMVHSATRDTPGAVTSMTSKTVNGKSYKICWGLGGTNYCKNLSYIGSTLSRFDAHAGLYNGKIIDSTINGMEITGCGELILDNVELFNQGSSSSMGAANSLFYLRGDYGCTWDGDITVKDLDWYVYNTGKLYLFYHGFVNWYYGYTAVFPNLSIENLDLYDIKTYEPINSGREIIYTGSTASSTSKAHLNFAHSKSQYAIVDNDKDGFVDEPIMDRNLDGFLDDPCDLDGDGKVGNTSINYDEARASASDYRRGIAHPTSYRNLNITKPPRYLKIVGNDGHDGNGGYTYVVPDTSANGISDGLYYNEVDSFGGFLGGTTFIYGDGEGEYFIGTKHKTQTQTPTFIFR